MPSFHYKAVNDKGQVFKGITTAFDENDVERDLSSAGLSLIHSKIIKESPLAKLLSSGIKTRAVVEFYHRLAQTLEIGLPILSALKENARYLPSKPMRQIAAEIKVAIEGGRSLFNAMAIYPKIFKKLDLAIIKMGEQTGVLPKCLKKMAAYLEWKEDLRAQIHKAIIYPAFIMVAITAVICVWIGYVLPKMVSVLSDLDVTIPRITALLLSVSEFAKTYWFWFTGAALGMLIILFALYKTNRGILLFHQYLLKIPLLGEVIYNSALSRLCHNFTTMLSAGMAIQQIFTTLADHALGNRYLEKRLEHAYREIESGESIASAFDTAGGFPSLLIGAIRNGEETGTLEDVFKRLGNYFDGEVKRTVQALVSAIEPITILALGSVFGLILLSILLPLYDVMGDIGKTY